MDTLDVQLLRPYWLLAIPVAWLLVYRLAQAADPMTRWKRFIAPHLLGQLVLGHDGQRVRNWPLLTLGTVWTLTALALAGPAWEREATPFAEDRAALMIVLEVSESMLGEDVQPTRLARAVHKIRDLLALRPDGKTGLVAYSGSAHLVMPLSEDPEVVRAFAADLTPDVMPLPGSDALMEAIAIAHRVLEAAKTPGSMLVLTDDFALPDNPATWPDSLIVLGITAEPDFGEAVESVGAELIDIAVDDRDVRAVNRLIERHYAAVSTDAQNWQDRGYGLLPFIAVLVLLWFRHGWIVRS